MKGTVTLVGAGCQRRELLTLAGLRALGEADVVVTDDLLAEGILDYAAPSAEIIYVGKRHGKRSASQEEINETLIRLASEGKRVCRLKGGDPFVFGRGGEEAIALREAGIAYEIIPGVSSAIAVPELWGIPVTHRRVSRSFHVITAHTADGPDMLPPDLDKLATLEGTLVFLMGLHRIGLLCERLIAAGKPTDTPAAVVGKRVVRATLGTIAEQARDFPAPAIILVGETAGMDLSPGTRPLDHLVIGLTGTHAFQEKLRRELQPYGGQLVSLHSNRLGCECAPETLIAALERGPEWVSFTSPNGVRLFFRLLRDGGYDLRGLWRVKFACVGQGTADALRECGILADLVPAEHNTAALGQALAEAATGTVLLAGAKNASSAPEEALARAGVRFERLVLYCLETVGVHDEEVDYVLFGSAGGVETYFNSEGRMPRRGAVCIGEYTAKRAREMGCDSVVLSRDASAEEMARALAEAQKEMGE